MRKRGMSKRSQAGVITVVVLILIVLAAIIIVYNVVMGILKKSSSEVSLDNFLVDGELEYYLPLTEAFVKIKRGNQNTNISGVKILFTDEDGTTHYNLTNIVPSPLETKKYRIAKADLLPATGDTWNFGKVKSISFFYIVNNKTSREIDKKEINEMNKSQAYGDECWYTDTDGDKYGTGSSNCKSPVPTGNYALVGGDCLDSNNAAYPGATEDCSNGVDNNCNDKIDDCSGNYYFASATKGGLMKTSGTFTPATGDSISLSLGFSFDFYGTTIPGTTNIIFCKSGKLLLPPMTATNCDVASTLDNLKSRKTIMPFGTSDSEEISDYKYQKNSDYVIFQLATSAGSLSEVILYNDGKIEFAYSGDISGVQVGISNGDNNKYTQKTLGGSISNDYTLTYTP